MNILKLKLINNLYFNLLQIISVSKLNEKQVHISNKSN